MGLLVDTDVLIILTHLDVFPFVVKMLIGSDDLSRCSCAFSEIEDLKGDLKLNGERTQEYTHGTIQKAIEYANQMTPLPLVDPRWLQAFRVRGVDHGERMLLASLVENEHMLLCSGDKNCMRALKRITKPMAMRGVDGIKGRVVALDSIWCLIAEKYGAIKFQGVCECASPKRGDIQRVFGVSSPIAMTRAWKTQRDLVKELEQDVPDDLLWTGWDPSQQHQKTA